MDTISLFAAVEQTLREYKVRYCDLTVTQEDNKHRKISDKKEMESRFNKTTIYLCPLGIRAHVIEADGNTGEEALNSFKEKLAMAVRENGEDIQRQGLEPLK